MQNSCKTSKSKQTQAKILEIARLVFARQGYHKTTVKDITQAAGLGYGTFYLYFKDKKDVFNALLEQVEDELYTASQGGSDLLKDYPKGRTSYRALREDLKAILTSFERNSSILKFSKELSYTDPEFNAKYEAMRNRLIKRTKQILQKSGLTSLNLDVAAIAISGMIEAVASEAIPKEDLLPTITKLYFKAVS